MRGELAENKCSVVEMLNMENNWRNTEEKIVLNGDIGRVLIFSQNVWSVAYDVIWSAATKLLGPRAFRHIVVVAVAIAAS